MYWIIVKYAGAPSTTIIQHFSVTRSTMSGCRTVLKNVTSHKYPAQTRVCFACMSNGNAVSGTGEFRNLVGTGRATEQSVTEVLR